MGDPHQLAQVVRFGRGGMQSLEKGVDRTDLVLQRLGVATRAVGRELVHQSHGEERTQRVATGPAVGRGGASQERLVQVVQRFRDG